jgi:hypothetical protein
MKSKLVLGALFAAALSVLIMAGTIWGAIIYESHANGMTNPNSGNAATSLTIAKPASVAVGDLLLAQITFEKGKDAGTDAQITPAGWTLVRRTNAQNHPNGTDLGQAIFYKVAGAAEPASYTFPFNQAVKAVGGIIRYSGVNLLHPNGPIVTSSGNSGDSSTLTALGINVAENTRLVALFGFKKKDTMLSIPDGMTGRYNFQNPQDVTIRAADQSAGVGATGNRVSTPSPSNSDKWVAQLVGLRGNTIPVYTGPAEQSVDEGEDKAFALGSFVDADAHSSWEITVDWGDGSADEVFTYNNTNPADPFAPRDLGTRNHTYDDNATYTVTVTVDDGENSHSGMFDVVVSNVAPTADLGNNGPIDEGSSATVSFTNQDDPSNADTLAGFKYAFDCDGVEANLPTIYADAGTTDDTSCAFDDNGNFDVVGRIFDKDDGYNTYTTTVQVDNVAPTATLSNDGPINEGSSATVSFSNQFDPSGADTTAGFQYAFDCDGIEANLPTTYADAGTADSTSCAFDDNGNFDVVGRIFDKDDGYNTYTTTVQVDNVAPTVNTPAVDPTSTNEGAVTAFDVSAGFTDPAGANDAPFTCSIDWGDGSSDAGTVDQDNFTCSFAGNHTYDDNGTYDVTVSVTDKDLDTGTSLATQVTVNNVAPTATFNAPAEVDEGAMFNLSLTAPSDPSGADTTAGFTYAFDCGDGVYSAFSSANNRDCTAGTPGIITVKGKVRDKDGGETEYTAQVTVNAVAPAGFTFYLHNRGTQPSTATTRLANLPMDGTVPTNAGALPNYDTNGDSSPGRLIQKNAPSATQSDLTKYQNWISPAFASDFVITKTTNAELKIWTAMKDLDSSKIGRIRVYIRDCPGTPQTNCVLIGQVDYVRPAGSPFSQATISVPWTFGPATYTVLSGRLLEVKVVVLDTSADDMWFGYDTSGMPAWLKYP